MVKAVIFDLSGVLINRVSDMGKVLGPLLNLNEREIHSKLKEEEFQDFLIGKISEDEYWMRIIKKNKWEIDVLSLKRTSKKSFREIKGTREVIIDVKKSGMKLGLLSAHVREWVYFLREKFDYEKYFDAILYSYQAGYTKPDIRLYKEIGERIQVEPKDCIYIDDKEKFLKPAEEIGMNIILFKSPEQLKEELSCLCPDFKFCS